MRPTHTYESYLRAHFVSGKKMWIRAAYPAGNCLVLETRTSCRFYKQTVAD